MNTFFLVSSNLQFTLDWYPASLSVLLVTDHVLLPYINHTHTHTLTLVIKYSCLCTTAIIHRVRLHFVLTKWRHTLTSTTATRQWKLCVVWERFHCFRAQNISVPLLFQSLPHLQDLSILGKNIKCNQSDSHLEYYQ